VTEPIRIGVLGAARIVPSGLLQPASEREDVRVTHVAARDPAREAAFAAQHGLTAAGGYEALIQHDDIDLVYIALPPSGHCEWSIRALEAGKAVLCEKPFAMSAQEAERMVAAAERAGRPLIEAFHYRYHPTVRRAEALLREGAIGRVISARASFCTTIPDQPGEFRWIRELGGGAVMDLGCYPIHALRTLIGGEPEVIAVEAKLERDVEVVTTARLQFEGGIAAEVRCAMRDVERALDVEIVGSRGRLTISNFIVPNFGATLTVETADRTFFEPAEQCSTYSAQLAHVVDVVLRGATPLTGGRDAIANMRVIERIRAMAEEGAGATCDSRQPAVMPH